jgi:uncharacterized Zn finger protein (UPF0148 family)
MQSQSTRLPRGTGKSEQRCPVCGTPFFAWASEHRVYCSKPCQLAGHPTTPPKDRTDSEAAFWALVEKTDTCWLWRGSTRSTGYGRLKRFDPSVGKVRTFAAHRFAFASAFGPIPDGMVVCHTCDNRLCVRNDDAGSYEVDGLLLPRRGHLFLGTHVENQADKVAKERQAAGEEQGHAKLTAAIVHEIRRRYAEGNITFVQLGAEYGITDAHAGKIVHRQVWTHIE